MSNKSNPDSFNLSFEVFRCDKDPEKYLVCCEEMMYEAWSKKPQEVMEGLVREWFDMDMGRETPDDYYDHSRE